MKDLSIVICKVVDKHFLQKSKHDRIVNIVSISSTCDNLVEKFSKKVGIEVSSSISKVTGMKSILTFW
jgi:hypothetical protein